jgi:alpha-tubulin suppressor-like RCC1 family protein
MSGRSNLSAGIKNDGTLWLWGYNSYGQLGLNNTVNKSSPTQVGSYTDWKYLSLYINAAQFGAIR